MSSASQRMSSFSWTMSSSFRKSHHPFGLCHLHSGKVIILLDYIIRVTSQVMLNFVFFLLFLNGSLVVLCDFLSANIPLFLLPCQSSVPKPSGSLYNKKFGLLYFSSSSKLTLGCLRRLWQRFRTVFNLLQREAGLNISFGCLIL